jgi:SAM-dependent methyltransferase
MSFDVAAASYAKFMGRYSEPLAELFADEAGVRAGQRVLDVGCGPGALTAVLVRRLGADAVAGVDPSEPFVEAAKERLPGVDIRRAAAEELPFEDDSFDAALAQLVVHFMEDPVAGLREMGRVTRPGSTIAACVWDHAGEVGPLSVFWKAVAQVDPDAVNESGLAGAWSGHLVQLAGEAGLENPVQGYLTVESRYETFEEWWEPYNLGVGPAGSYTKRLDEPERAVIRELCHQLLPPAPFDMRVSAWSVVALSPGR